MDGMRLTIGLGHHRETHHQSSGTYQHDIRDSGITFGEMREDPKTPEDGKISGMNIIHGEHMPKELNGNGRTKRKDVDPNGPKKSHLVAGKIIQRSRTVGNNVKKVKARSQVEKIDSPDKEAKVNLTSRGIS